MDKLFQEYEEEKDKNLPKPIDSAFCKFCLLLPIHACPMCHTKQTIIWVQGWGLVFLKHFVTSFPRKSASTFNFEISPEKKL